MQSQKLPPDLSKPKEVTLDEGTLAIIRPIRPEDAPYLKSGFAWLSANEARQ